MTDRRLPERKRRIAKLKNLQENTILRFAQNGLLPVSVIADSEADPQSHNSKDLTKKRYSESIFQIITICNKTTYLY